MWREADEPAWKSRSVALPANPQAVREPATRSLPPTPDPKWRKSRTASCCTCQIPDWLVGFAEVFVQTVRFFEFIKLSNVCFCLQLRLFPADHRTVLPVFDMEDTQAVHPGTIRELPHPTHRCTAVSALDERHGAPICARGRSHHPPVEPLRKCTD